MRTGSMRTGSGQTRPEVIGVILSPPRSPVTRIWPAASRDAAADLPHTLGVRVSKAPQLPERCRDGVAPLVRASPTLRAAPCHEIARRIAASRRYGVSVKVNSRLGLSTLVWLLAAVSVRKS